MVIKKRPVITWLLNKDNKEILSKISIADVSIPVNQELLFSYLQKLNEINSKDPEWGLPELVMPSFEEVMRKSEKSFEKLIPDLYEEFSKSDECGILLLKNNVSLVYGFGGNQLHLWYFYEQEEKSLLNFYSVNISEKGQTGVGIANTIIADNNLFHGSLEQRQNNIGSLANFVVLYLAVKKYVKVETVIIPPGKFIAIEGTPLEYVDKKKVINNLGQKVIVMDSKWFRKIINDNDIFVRGFWRMQNKKDEFGEWYKELIFIDPFIRHGYHRNARIEEEREGDENE